MENNRFEIKGTDTPENLERDRKIFDQAIIDHESDESRRDRAKYIIDELATVDELAHDFAEGVAKFNNEVTIEESQRHPLVLPNGRTVTLYYGNDESGHVRIGYKDK